MGWKSVKEHYRIDHLVHVTDQGICIGSAYIHNIIVIGRDGQVIRRYTGSMNEDLARYQRDFDADPTTLQRLVEAEDSFSSWITVYTYEGGRILEKQCEEPGWPNVTHDGQMMHDNTFSTDRPKVVEWAKENADLGIRYAQEAIVEAEKRLSECKVRWTTEVSNRNRLDADYPVQGTALPPKLGVSDWSETFHTEGNHDLSCWFGLDRATFLTLPRVLMEAMPDEWQGKMAALLNAYTEAFPNWPDGMSSRVQITNHGKLARCPGWLMNYRHPDRSAIDALRPSSETRP